MDFEVCNNNKKKQQQKSKCITFKKICTHTILIHIIEIGCINKMPSILENNNCIGVCVYIFFVRTCYIRLTNTYVVLCCVVKYVFGLLLTDHRLLCIESFWAIVMRVSFAVSVFCFLNNFVICK